MRRFTLAGLLLAAAAASNAQPLRLERSIPLAGVDGRLGQLAFDAKGQRLFVPVTSAGSIEIVDVKTGQRRKPLTGFKSPVSVAYDALQNRLFIGSRADGSLSMVDARTYAVLKRIIVAGHPEMVRVEPRSKQVLVAYGNNVDIMDVNGRQLGTIRLDAAAGSFHASSTGPQVWINVPSTRYIAYADRNSRSVRQTWPVSTTGSGGPNYGMGIDEKNRRLFVACRRPATLVILSLDTGYRIDTRATVNNADEVHYDAANARLYVPGADGQIDVVLQTKPDRYEALARIDSAPGARTALLSPELQRFYLAVPKRSTQAAEIRVYAVSK